MRYRRIGKYMNFATGCALTSSQTLPFLPFDDIFNPDFPIFLFWLYRAGRSVIRICICVCEVLRCSFSIPSCSLVLIARCPFCIYRIEIELDWIGLSGLISFSEYVRFGLQVRRRVHNDMSVVVGQTLRNPNGHERRIG